MVRTFLLIAGCAGTLLAAGYEERGAASGGTPDTVPRPKNLEEYLAQMDAFSAADKANGAEFKAEDVPMLTRDQKRQAIREFGHFGRVGRYDYNVKPGQPAERIRELKDSFVAYYNAPYGSVEERQAWVRFMRAIQEGAD